MAKEDLGHSVIFYKGMLWRVITVTPLDDYEGKMDSNVTPLGQAPSAQALNGSVSRHPAGRKMKCPAEGCNHARGAHTEKGAGCAYCKCKIVYAAP